MISPRRKCHGIGAGHAERCGANRYGHQPNDDHRLPPDVVGKIPPEITTQETAERERARHVAGIETCFIQLGW